MIFNIRMAWRNIWRNPRRSLLTMAAVVFSCVLLVFSVSLQLGSYDTLIEATVERYTGHLQVQAEGYDEDREMRQAIARPDEVTKVLKDIPWVEAFSQRSNAFALVSSEERTYGVGVTGIDPKREKGVSNIHRVVRRGEYLSDPRAREALVGTLLADNLKVDVGEELVLLGQGFDGSIAATALTVRGIFESGEPGLDRSFLQMPLRTFDEVFFMNGEVHEIVVTGRDLEELPRAARTIGDLVKPLQSSPPLRVLTWRELLPGVDQSIRMDMVSGWMTYGILVFIVALGIMNTFVMTVLERTREFGMLLAMGMRQGRVARLVLMESALMTLVGIVAGIFAGCLLTYYFQIHGIEIPGSEEIMAQWGLPSRFRPELSPLSVLLGPAMVFGVTLLTAVLSTLRIRRLRPSQALRAV